MKFVIEIIPDNKEDKKEITTEEVAEGLQCYFSQCNILTTVTAKKIKNNDDRLKAKEQILKSLKWIVFNLGDTKNNTIENAIKVYVESAILFINNEVN